MFQILSGKQRVKTKFPGENTDIKGQQEKDKIKQTEAANVPAVSYSSLSSYLNTNIGKS